VVSQGILFAHMMSNLLKLGMGDIDCELLMSLHCICIVFAHHNCYSLYYFDWFEFMLGGKKIFAKLLFFKC